MSAAATASTPLLEINGARATIRLNRPKHLNRLQPDDLDGAAQAVRPDRGRSRDPGAGADRHRPRLQRRLRSRLDRRARQPARRRNRAPDRRSRSWSTGSRTSRYRRSAGSTAASMAARPIWRWPAISASASTACEMFMPAARLGLHYYKSGIRRYVSRLGVDNAKKLFLTAQKIDAAEMLRIGYLTAMVSAEALDQEVDRTRRRSRRQCAGRDARHEAHHQRIRPRQARRGSRRPPRPRQHARRRDQGRHQGVRRETSAEVLGQ